MVQIASKIRHAVLLRRRGFGLQFDVYIIVVLCLVCFKTSERAFSTSYTKFKLLTPKEKVLETPPEVIEQYELNGLEPPPPPSQNILNYIRLLDAFSDFRLSLIFWLIPLALICLSIVLKTWILPIRSRLVFRRASIKEATHILVHPSYGNGSPTLTMLKKTISVSKPSSPQEQGAEYPGYNIKTEMEFSGKRYLITSPSSPSPSQGQSTRGRSKRKDSLRSQSTNVHLERIKLTTKVPLSVLHHPAGHQESEVADLLERYGKNKYPPASVSFEALLRRNLVSPSFIFEVFSSILWLFDSFALYSLTNLLMLVGSVAVSALQELSSLKELEVLRPSVSLVHVFRNKQWTLVHSSRLVPGDIIAMGTAEEMERLEKAGELKDVKEGGNKKQQQQQQQQQTQQRRSPINPIVMLASYFGIASAILPRPPKRPPAFSSLVQADLLLLDGQCVVDESSLTGEAVPVIKESIRGVEEGEEGVEEIKEIKEIKETEINKSENSEMKQNQEKTEKVINMKLLHNHSLLAGTTLLSTSPPVQIPLESSDNKNDESGSSSYSFPSFHNLPIFYVVRTSIYTSQHKLMDSVTGGEGSSSRSGLRGSNSSSSRRSYILSICIHYLLTTAVTTGSIIHIIRHIRQQDTGTQSSRSSSSAMAFKCLIIGASVINPNLFADLSFAAANSLGLLKEKGVHTAVPDRIAEGGAVQLMAFDKTGTLTGELEVVSVCHGEEEEEREDIEDIESSSGSLNRQDMASSIFGGCNSLVSLCSSSSSSSPSSSSVSGAPMEHLAFTQCGFTFNNNRERKRTAKTASPSLSPSLSPSASTYSDSVLSAVLSFSLRDIPQSPERERSITALLEDFCITKTVRTLHRYPFNSTLKRMSAICEVSYDPADVQVVKDELRETYRGYKAYKGYKGIDLPSLSDVSARVDEYIDRHSGLFLFTKGAPEIVLPLCVASSDVSSNIQKINRLMVQGYRIIVTAYRRLSSVSLSLSPPPRRQEMESNLTYNSTAVYTNSLKAKTEQHITNISRAGLRSVMVSGDAVLSCVGIALKVGIARERERDGERTGDKTGDKIGDNVYVLSAFTDNKNNKTETETENVSYTLHFQHIRVFAAQDQRETEEREETSSSSFSISTDTTSIQQIQSLYATHTLVAYDPLLSALLTTLFQLRDRLDGERIQDTQSTQSTQDIQDIQKTYSVLLFSLLSFRILARTTPLTKARYISALETARAPHYPEGIRCMMVGDGTNDVGALNEASVGVALFKTRDYEVVKKWREEGGRTILGIPIPNKKMMEDARKEVHTQSGLPVPRRMGVMELQDVMLNSPWKPSVVGYMNRPASLAQLKTEAERRVLERERGRERTGERTGESTAAAVSEEMKLLLEEQTKWRLLLSGYKMEDIPILMDKQRQRAITPTIPKAFIPILAPLMSPQMLEEYMQTAEGGREGGREKGTTNSNSNSKDGFGDGIPTASLVAPFTSKSGSIKGALLLLRQGRATLASQVSLFVTSTIYNIISVLSQTYQLIGNVKSNSYQMVIEDLFSTAISLCLVRIKPVKEISRRKVNRGINDLSVMVGMMTQIALIIALMVYVNVYTGGSGSGRGSGGDGVYINKFYPSLRNTSFFFVSLVTSVTTHICNYSGRPHMRDVFEYKALRISVLVIYGIIAALVLQVFPEINTLIGLVLLEGSGRWKLVGMMALYVVGSFSVTWFCKRFLVGVNKDTL